MPKVSVVIPVYNVEKYLRECLDSVINQTLKDIEIICVNDGSTDDSLVILNEYAKKDSRIKVISQENRGVAAARNTGLEYVTAPYVYFLDSDDFVDPNLLDYAVTIFENFDIDYFVFSSEACVDDEECSQSLEDMDNYIKVKRDGVYDVNADIGWEMNIHVWNKVFKTELLKENNIKFIDGLLYEDIYFMWYYLFLSKKAYFESEIFHHYRMRSSSIMETVTRNKSYETAIHHMYNWYELFLSISSNRELFVRNFETLNNMLSSYSIRTKELVPPLEKYKVEKLKIEYNESLHEKYRDALKIRYRGLEKLFSIKNTPDKRCKVLCVCGVKMKFRRRCHA